MTKLTPMRRRAIDRLLIQYLELPELEQTEFINRCRSRFPRLCRYLDRLVDSGRTVTLLDDSVRQVAGDAVQARAESEKHVELPPGTEIGPWRIVEVIGQGGMGMVYRGERADGAFEMNVAIKLIGRRKRGLAELLQRECRLLAKLDHPSVTRLLDAGLDDRAGPFLVMEWVDGIDLADWIERNKPSLETRLRLFGRITEAIAHAHQRLIVHGDIKPSNIRVREDGTVKLLDFGIARIVDEDTDAGHLRALTPSFAAPEQLAGADISPTSDIWSLGALLFWLLTGRIMQDIDTTIQNTIAAQGHARWRELAAIVIASTATAPGDRYQSSPALLAELLRFQARRPLEAMPTQRRYRLACFVVRNWLAVGLTALFVAIVAAGLGAVLWQSEQTRQEAERALAASARTEAIKDFLVEMLAESDPYIVPGEPPTVRDMLQRSSEQVAERFSDQPDIALEILTVIGVAQQALGHWDSANELLEGALDLIQTGAVTMDDAAIANQEFLLAQTLEDSEAKRELLLSAWKRVEGDSEARLLQAGILSLQAHGRFLDGNAQAAAEHIRQAIYLACQKDAIEEDPHYCSSVSGDGYFYLNAAGANEEAIEAARTGYEMMLGLHQDSPHPRVISSGISYANALIDHRQPAEAVALTTELLEVVYATFGANSSRVAYVHFPLARANATLGRDHVAVEKWRHALDIMLETQPDGLGIPVQLNFMADSLLALGKADAARQAYRKYFPVVWENTPQHALWYQQINELQMELIDGDSIPAARWHEQWADFRELPGQYPLRFLMLALSNALEQGDLEAARAWKEEIVASEPESGQGWMLRARYWLQGGDTQRAEKRIESAFQAFAERGEVTGPRLSALQAVQAELSCQRGMLDQGREQLAGARQYWLEEAGLPEPARQLDELAPSCQQGSGSGNGMAGQPDHSVACSALSTAD